MDLHELVFRVGDRVTGWGEIREDDDGVWFDPPHSVPLIRLPSGQRLPRSPNAVRLTGADPFSVCAEFTDDGGIPGWATVTGIWLGDSIQVQTQDVRPPPSWRGLGQPVGWELPPCPEPAEAWPAGTDQDIHAVDLHDLRESANCVVTVMFRPRSDSVVLVVAASDVAAAEAEWRPRLGPRVCVVQSRWSNPELAAVTSTLLAHWDDWRISMVSRPTDDRAQQWVDAELLRITPAVADWVDELSDGIFEAKPTLTPARPH